MLCEMLCFNWMNWKNQFQEIISIILKSLQQRCKTITSWSDIIVLIEFVFRNKFIDSLAAMASEGNSMDESTIFQIPEGLLEHMDQIESNNPDLFVYKLLEESQAKADALSSRMSYLGVSYKLYIVAFIHFC